MTDKVVFLNPRQPLAFLASACAALAEALEDTVALGPNRDELAAVYAEVVGAYARLLRAEVARMPEMSRVWFDVVDHLLGRLKQVRDREILLDHVEVASQLHARLLEITTTL